LEGRFGYSNLLLIEIYKLFFFGKRLQSSFVRSKNFQSEMLSTYVTQLF